VNGSKPNCKNVTCRIPLGSTLGLLLFINILYINDLPPCPKFKTVLNAGNTNVSLSHSSEFSLQIMVNQELRKVHE